MTTLTQASLPTTKIKSDLCIFAKRCILYFPPNRFEEPAWLNEENLKAQAQYMDLKTYEGDKRIVR